MKCTMVGDSYIGVCTVQGWDTSSSILLILICENLYHLVQKLEGGGGDSRQADINIHTHTESMVLSFLKRGTLNLNTLFSKV